MSRSSSLIFPRAGLIYSLICCSYKSLVDGLTLTLLPAIHPLAGGHPGGFPVVVLVQGGDGLGHLFPDFFLRPGIDALADVLPGARVDANDEAGLPGAVLPLAYAALIAGAAFLFGHSVTPCRKKRRPPTAVFRLSGGRRKGVRGELAASAGERRLWRCGGLCLRCILNLEIYNQEPQAPHHGEGQINAYVFVQNRGPQRGKE